MSLQLILGDDAITLKNIFLVDTNNMFTYTNIFSYIQKTSSNKEKIYFLKFVAFHESNRLNEMYLNYLFKKWFEQENLRI